MAQFNRWRNGSLLLVGLLLVGCASHADHLMQARSQYYSGDLTAAEASLSESIDKHRSEADVLKLDQAMVLLTQGRHVEAERLLRDVRDEFDYLEQKALTEEALAFLTDETSRAYAGEEYERILIRVMLALTSLSGDGFDAEAYALQIAAEQRDVTGTEINRAETDVDESNGEGERVAAAAFEPNRYLAIGPYIRGVLAEASHTRFDDAARNYAQAVSWQPTFDAGRIDVERATHGRHSQRGNGVVYLFALVGRGPYKEVVNEVPTSQALLVADRILSATGKHTLPPTIAPIKVPKVVRAPNSIDRILVAVDDQPQGQTSIVTDITAMAVAQNEADFNQIVGRAVARRVVKKAVVYTAKEATSFSDNGLLNLAFDAMGVVWEATETADTRCWGMLPDTIQVLRVELPAGEHVLSLTPATGTGPKGAAVEVSINVENGRNTYVLANFPGPQVSGEVSVATH